MSFSEKRRFVRHLCPDIASNVIWDGMREAHNHSFLVKFLAERNIVSAYHFFSECQGEEKRPSHYFYHHKNRGYHIDYVFLPQPWANRIEKVEVGKYRECAKISDHVPLTVSIEAETETSVATMGDARS